MKLSTKGRYSLRMMLEFADHNHEGCLPLHRVSQELDLSTKYLEQLAALLVQADLLTTKRGPNGGYTLAKPAAHITVGDILRATEGTYLPAGCLDPHLNEPIPENVDERCVAFWQELAEVITRCVEGVSLEDIKQTKIPS